MHCFDIMDMGGKRLNMALMMVAVQTSEMKVN
jgi:hypothetical protein